MSTRQRLCLAVRLGNWRQSPLLITKCQKISKFLQLWMRCIFFIQQLFLSLQRIHHRALALTTYDKFLNLSDGMHFSTQQIITSNLELYHILIIEKRFPGWANHTMSQKSHDSSRHSCGTICKKLHFTYLFFYQTTRSFAAVVLSQVEISLLNEQASKKLTRLVTATKILNWVLWNAARCAIIHPQASTHDCLVACQPRLGFSNI